MTINEAIDKACAEVGIHPPKRFSIGRWAKTDTLAGKSGKGDGRVIVNDKSATAYNWQTSQRATVWLDGEMTQQQRRELAAEISRAKEKARLDAARAADTAVNLMNRATSRTHPYLSSKGFSDEQTLVIDAAAVRAIAGDYIVPAGASNAVLIPARRDGKISSAQLIWEDGTKKFIFGGEIAGASHRIATGVDTWLCEGYATGLSVRAALKGLKMQATVLCCFSASNILFVARQLNSRGRAFIAADHDKPIPHFAGLGTGEYFARQAGMPYGMPPDIQTDFNDMHQHAGIFAVQRALTAIMAGRRAA